MSLFCTEVVGFSLFFIEVAIFFFVIFGKKWEILAVKMNLDFSSKFSLAFPGHSVPK